MFSFSLNGIFESNGTSNITVASLSASPTSNTLGDVWVNSDDDTVNFWDGSTWITLGSTIVYQSASPTYVEVGKLWIDSTTNFIYVWDGSQWVQASGGGGGGGGSKAFFYVPWWNVV